MKKPKLLVPAMYAREMIDSPDLDRLLASGSYLIATKPKKPSTRAIAQREYMRRRFAAGYKNLDILLPEPIFNQMRAMLREGETFAELVGRLILSSGGNEDISLVQTDN